MLHFIGMVDSSEANGIRMGTCLRDKIYRLDTSDMNVSNADSKISKRMRVTNLGQRSNILNNESCTYVYMPSGCLRALELRKTHPYSIRDPSVQRWETHGDPSVQSLSSNHFHFFAVFTGERGRGFTRITLRLDDMLIHNLTYLFNADGQIVCLKLMPKAPNQRRKR